MKVYFISGMAADKRVFRHIQVPAGFEAVFLDWITPLPNESLAAYALRMAEAIDHTKPFALVGLSFGGMLATEIAKQYAPAVTVLISSIPVSGHLPPYYKVAGKLGLHKIIPVSLIKTSAATKRLFTKERNADKKLLWQIIDESDMNLIRWSMHAILNWQNETIPQPMYHIHGTRDEVLPLRYTKPTHIIRGHGHMLVMSQPDRINELLAKALFSCIEKV